MNVIVDGEEIFQELALMQNFVYIFYLNLPYLHCCATEICLVMLLMKQGPNEYFHLQPWYSSTLMIILGVYVFLHI